MPNIRINISLRSWYRPKIKLKENDYWTCIHILTSCLYSFITTGFGNMQLFICQGDDVSILCSKLPKKKCSKSYCSFRSNYKATFQPQETLEELEELEEWISTVGNEVEIKFLGHYFTPKKSLFRRLYFPKENELWGWGLQCSTRLIGQVFQLFHFIHNNVKWQKKA